MTSVRGGHCLDCDQDVIVITEWTGDGYDILDGADGESDQHVNHDVDLEQ